MLIALVVAFGGCGGDDDSGGTDAGASPTTTSEVAADFCEAWNVAVISGDHSAIVAVLADAPSELATAAAIVRETDADGTRSRASEAAAAEIQNWTELHCQQVRPGESQRRIAPPIDTEIDGVTFCGTTFYPRAPDDGRSGMVLYGMAGADDPYDGPMLGVLWNQADAGGHRGDGDAQPVTVRGLSGVAAPITVFQQTVLPELGTVIAWTEGDLAVGLYGRQWSIGQTEELVAIAELLEAVDGRFRLPDDALPEGYAEVFAGIPSVASIVLPASPLYSLRYQASEGILAVYGRQMSEEEFEAFRFFTIGVDRGDVAGRGGRLGNAWHDDGPAVVTWREPDGLVIRVVGIGAPLDAALEVAGTARELTPDEWAALVEAEDRCEPPLSD